MDYPRHLASCLRQARSMALRVVSTERRFCCPLALQSLTSFSFIKSLRLGLLENGKRLGPSKIRGGLILKTTDQQFDSMHLTMETDDSKDGESHLITQPASYLTKSNFGLITMVSPRWPFEQSCWNRSAMTFTNL
jgi:hypothetical protein